MSGRLESDNMETLDTGSAQKIEYLERIIDVDINDPFLFVRALKHRSVLGEEAFRDDESYERLEFLGDAVLDLIISEFLYDRFPMKPEGFLTKLRARLVRGDSLAHYADSLDLGSIVVVGERVQGQGIERSKSILADIFESLVGALYIDQDYVTTREFVLHTLKRFVDMNDVISTMDNYKSLLLEFTQAREMSHPVYEIVSEEGPDHDKVFKMKVLIEGKEWARAEGKSKKKAEQKASRKALDILSKELE